MMSRNIVNIINFVRGSHDYFKKEHECDEMNLITIKKEIELCKEYMYKNTVLLEYNAIVRECFQNLMAEYLDDNLEIGLWLEIDRKLIDSVGLKWEGKAECEWDPYSKLPFTPAYTFQEKVLIIDECMKKFNEVFGSYPKSVGAWMLDSYSVEYMAEKYGIVSVCICREQWGTDGYTLWGGYFSNGYYPSKNNIIVPAQSKEAQINVPVFRMLGSDPIYEYDNNSTLYKKLKISRIYTMEAASNYYKLWDGDHESNRAYYKWYFNNTCKNESLKFSYVQIGQENSFNWAKNNIGENLRTQFDEIKVLLDKGTVKVETLSETGTWFKSSFVESPNGAVSVLTDWKNEGRKTIWFNSKHYRANLLNENGNVCFRDIQLYDEKFRDKYLDTPCEGGIAYQTALPIIDGSRWRSHEERIGLFIYNGEIVSSQNDGNNLVVKIELKNKDEVRVKFSQSKISITALENVELKLELKSDCKLPIIDIKENEIKYSENGFKYALKIEKGLIKNKCSIVSKNGEIIFKMN